MPVASVASSNRSEGEHPGNQLHKQVYHQLMVLGTGQQSLLHENNAALPVCHIVMASVEMRTAKAKVETICSYTC